MLMQSALMKADKNERVIEALIDVLRQAEELFKDQQQRESGLKLLQTAKGTLKKLVNS